MDLKCDTDDNAIDNNSLSVSLTGGENGQIEAEPDPGDGARPRSGCAGGAACSRSSRHHEEQKGAQV